MGQLDVDVLQVQQRTVGLDQEIGEGGAQVGNCHPIDEELEGLAGRLALRGRGRGRLLWRRFRQARQVEVAVGLAFYLNVAPGYSDLGDIKLVGRKIEDAALEGHGAQLDGGRGRLGQSGLDVVNLHGQVVHLELGRLAADFGSGLHGQPQSADAGVSLHVLIANGEPVQVKLLQRQLPGFAAGSVLGWPGVSAFSLGGLGKALQVEGAGFILGKIDPATVDREFAQFDLSLVQIKAAVADAGVGQFQEGDRIVRQVQNQAAQVNNEMLNGCLWRLAA